MRARLLAVVLAGLIPPACTTFTSDGPREPDAGGADAAPDATDRDASADGDGSLRLGDEITVPAPTEIALGDDSTAPSSSRARVARSTAGCRERRAPPSP